MFSHCDLMPWKVDVTVCAIACHVISSVSDLIATKFLRRPSYVLIALSSLSEVRGYVTSSATPRRVRTLCLSVSGNLVSLSCRCASIRPTE